MKRLILIFCVWMIAGCAETLPSKMNVNKDYSMMGVRTYSLTVDGSRAVVDTTLGKEFSDGYCQMLEGGIKMAMRQTCPEMQFVPESPADMVLDVAVEQLIGGDAAARFLIGFGAGRSVSTVYARIYKNGAIQAEARITETTTMPNIAADNFTNEDALMQDVPLLSKNIARFVSDPSGYSAAAQGVGVIPTGAP